ncbi:hypothetical protein EMPS_09388 [Entomortierella parvispora]|uniref:BZIP domain-containing protein n=1 Tax=Entomortierella parvispora TaxID=205924 RepID=A0A9P3HHV9_9FUNG|nr:hypothetical protein EMPS_09388 [Entomortierella parvispora]
MADYSYLALIESLNSDTPAVSTGSPDDFTDLALWTNAEFTFDLDSTPFLDSSALLDPPSQEQKQLDQQQQEQQEQDQQQQQQLQLQQQQYGMAAPGLDYMNLTPEQQSQSRPMSLLERTRQGNPVAGQAQLKTVLQEQIAAANSYQSLMASHSNSTLQQSGPQFASLIASSTDLTAAITPTATMLSTLAAPVSTITPAAAKVLRQDMPQYKVPFVPVIKDNQIQPAVQSPTQLEEGQEISNIKETTATAENDKEIQGSNDGYELSAADSFSKDDPAYLTKVAAEEDKRRRNTAASARFRQKKRLREQALEQTAREQTARAEALENHVRELEMEVRWLRGLIVEKDSRLHEATMSLRDHQTQLNDLLAANGGNGIEGANKRIRMDAF